VSLRLCRYTRRQFVTDLRSGKEHEIDGEHDVCLIFIDPDEKTYLSITARAEVCRDPGKAAEIWKSTDSAWWSGPHDPNVCVLRVTPLTAELWDGPCQRGARRLRVRQSTAHRWQTKSGRESRGNRESTMTPNKPSNRTRGGFRWVERREKRSRAARLRKRPAHPYGARRSCGKERAPIPCRLVLL
jgi:Pyridoxamine 5'-phosphate oxidase like